MKTSTLLNLTIPLILTFYGKSFAEDIMYVIGEKQDKINEKTLNESQLEKKLSG